MTVILEKRNLCGLIIDSTLTEAHSKSGRVTSEPISTGSNASDHMFSNPNEITLRGTIGAIPPSDYRSGLQEPRRGTDNFPLLNNLGNINLNDSAGIADRETLRQDLINSLGISHFGSEASQFNSPEERTVAALSLIHI